MNKLELKIPPPLVMLIFALLMRLSAKQLPALDYTLSGYQLIAGGFILMAVLLDVTALLTFRSWETTINPLNPKRASTLVTQGVFQFSRNPMYLGLAFILTAWSIWLSNGISVIFIPLFILYLNRFQISPEEKALTELFGNDYKEYCTRVRRWL